MGHAREEKRYGEEDGLAVRISGNNTTQFPIWRTGEKEQENSKYRSGPGKEYPMIRTLNSSPHLDRDEKALEKLEEFPTHLQTYPSSFFKALTHHPFSHAANDSDYTFFSKKKNLCFFSLVATTSTEALVRRCPLKRLRQQPSSSLLLLCNLASGAVGKFSPLLPRSNGERSEGW